ncbi:MAG: hypothetical protein WCF10_10235 [Polyangiales bacterium]
MQRGQMPLRIRARHSREAGGDRLPGVMIAAAILALIHTKIWEKKR